MKIYTIFCRYIFDGDIVDIQLSEMLKRLNLEPHILEYDDIEYGIEYGVEELIQYNVDRAYKVKYFIGIKQDKNYKKEPFEYRYISDDARNFVEYLNSYHDDLIIRMSEEEFKTKYKNYGNNYLKQIKRRTKNDL